MTCEHPLGRNTNLGVGQIGFPWELFNDEGVPLTPWELFNGGKSQSNY
jgi:hypothetical protein